MNSIGSFILCRNEDLWIGPHIKAWLPYLDEMVFFDGNSTDGTLDIINYCKDKYDPQGKIKLFLDKDPKDMKDDYVRFFDKALRSLSTDLAIFIHPDMHPVNPGKLNEIKMSDAIAMFSHMRSFAGDPEGIWFEVNGRSNKWKNVYRLKNPDLGAHYFGHYGANAENVYFSEITGSEHITHGIDFQEYPYEVEDSGLKILHFSDVRDKSRRLERMKTCLENQEQSGDLNKMAENHPRVTLEPGDFRNDSFSYSPGTGKEFNDYLALRPEFESMRGISVKA